MSASEKERENMSLYSVLLVDDEEEVFQVIMKKLDWEGMGFRIAGYARNGVEALEMAEELSVDVVMTDIKMPYMDGLTLCRKLKEQYQKIKVIIFSGFDEFEYAREALKLYAFDYILKPFEDGELEAAVLRAREKILRSREKKEENENSLLPFDENSPGLSGYVREAVRYMAVHYGESEITVAQIAEAVGISEGHLSHCFKKETGYTVMAWLTRYRIQSAMKLLSDCRNKVYEAAEQVGYRDIAYFSSTFKKVTGITPSEYQNR